MRRRVLICLACGVWPAKANERPCRTAHHSLPRQATNFPQGRPAMSKLALRILHCVIVMLLVGGVAWWASAAFQAEPAKLSAERIAGAAGTKTTTVPDGVVRS